MNHQHFASTLRFSPYSAPSLSPSPPDLPTERKMKKPLMERKRRERINNSLNQLKEYHLQLAPHQRSKLEKADILEMTVTEMSRLQKQVATGGAHARSHEETTSIFRRGVEYGFAHASRAVFEYLSHNMPTPENSPQAQQFHMGLVQHLRRCSLSGFQSSSVNPKFSPLSPESSGSESPESRHSPTSMSLPSSVFMTPLTIPLSSAPPPRSFISTPLSSFSKPSRTQTSASPDEDIEVTVPLADSAEVWQPWK